MAAHHLIRSFYLVPVTGKSVPTEVVLALTPFTLHCSSYLQSLAFTIQLPVPYHKDDSILKCGNCVCYF